MANRIKNRVKTSMAKGFSAKRYADQGKRKGEQGKARHPGYSGGKRTKALVSNTVKRAYAKRVRASK